MAKYSEAIIEEIKRRIPIEEVVSAYTTLSQKGGRLWGKCPFHEDKTPSFSLIPEKNWYYCFSCKRSGSIFDFVMETEHVTFPEAVQMLAKRCGVALAEETEQDRKKRGVEDALLELHNRLAGSFHYLLLNSQQAQATAARDYLQRRNVSSEMIEKFNLGYAPADGSWLYSFLKKQNYSDELLAASGLFSQRNPRYPLFRDRLMFPIRTWQGKTVAFGGRDLSGDPKSPKYINTGDTLIYSKKYNLFGIYESLATLKSEGAATLCEGNFDVVAMHQSGICNAVAPLGTSFTFDQAKLLGRYCKTINIVFDSDAAGQASTGKALVICQGLGIDNRVKTIMGGKDASEVVEKQGEDALKGTLSRSLQGFDYLVQNALKEYDVMNPKGKTSILAMLRPYLDATESAVEKQTYLRKLADILKVDEASVYDDYQQRGKTGQGRSETGQKRAQDVMVREARVTLDLFTMLTLVNNRNLFMKCRRQLQIEDLEDPAAKEIYNVLEDTTREGVGKTDEVILQAILNDQLRQQVAASFLMERYKANPTGVLAESIDRIHLRKLLKHQQNFVALLTVNDDGNNILSDSVEILNCKFAVDKEIAEIKDRLSRISETKIPQG